MKIINVQTQYFREKNTVQIINANNLPQINNKFHVHLLKTWHLLFVYVHFCFVATLLLRIFVKARYNRPKWDCIIYFFKSIQLTILLHKMLGLVPLLIDPLSSTAFPLNGFNPGCL